VNINKSLADERNQPTSFPTARSSKESPKNPIKPKTQLDPKNQWVELFLKKPGFSEPYG